VRVLKETEAGVPIATCAGGWDERGDMVRSWLNQIGKLTLKALLLGAMIVGALIVLEGFSSVILLRFLLSGKGERPLAEQRHTQYDQVLGWVNIPNLVVQDMYGPGVFLRTNAQGFRGNRYIGVNVPDRKLRVICSGDSFTLGYGVDDDHTWCQLLGSMDQRLEPVNMGQGGYGVDQSYLWYKRDGSILNHDVHIFAFVTADFYRMETSKFLGYGKPILDLGHGHLVVKNVPVPRRRWYAPWATRSVAAIRQLKSYELAVRAIGHRRSRQKDGDDDTHDHTWEVALKVFESLHEMNEARKSLLVLLCLPGKADYLSSASEIWRRRLAAESKKRGWVYIDLITEMRQLAPDQIEELFIPPDQIQFLYASGHYTVAGNKWVAQRLYQRISALPHLSRKLAGER